MAGKSSGRLGLNEVDVLAREFVQSRHICEAVRDEWLKADSSERKAMADKFFTLRCWRDEFYEYSLGRYRVVSDSEMRRRIVRFLLELNELSDMEQDSRIRITTQLVKNIMLCIGSMAHLHIPDRQKPYSVIIEGLPFEDDGSRNSFVFQNGNLLLSDALSEPAFYDHSPQFFALNKANYRYDPDATAPNWQAFLEDVMDGDQYRIRLLRQWAGYLISGRIDLHKFMLIAGEGRNGKTVFTTMIEKMIGEDDVSHMPIQQFSNQFALVSTLGKLLNSTSESTHAIDEMAETMLKCYTSGDRMTFQRKYKEPIHARPTARIMISTNQLPQFRDKSYGIWRRMLFVPFDKCYDEDRQNPNLICELSSELSGIFNWALEGMQDLKETGRFITPDRSRAEMEQYRRDTNPARSFLLDNFVQGFEFEGIETGELYRLYRNWCDQNGYRAMSNGTFGKEVLRAFEFVSRKQGRKGGKRVAIYKALAMMEGAQVADSRMAATV